MRPSLLFVLFNAGVAVAQVADYANSGYRTPESRARVASALNDPHRDTRQRPKELMEALQIRPGSTVVDLGTGVGYLLPWMSRAVGEHGHVIGVDIFIDFLEKARQKVLADGLRNVTLVLGAEKDPMLVPNSADLILALDAYHHFDYPETMLAGIGRALKPGGRFAIVDFYKSAFRDPKHIRLDEAEVIQEVEANGFRLLSSKEFNPKSQYLALFEKK